MAAPEEPGEVEGTGAREDLASGRTQPERHRDRRVNRTLRGWYGSFQHSKANVFETVDGYVRRRMRSLLQWRLDGVGQGIGATQQRWPNEWFARCGLLSLKAEHEWTRTIVSLRTH